MSGGDELLTTVYPSLRIISEVERLERLREEHEQLARYFATSPEQDDSEAKTRDQYFVDHGLSPDQCDCLRELVRKGLRHRPLEAFGWQTAYLPLVVCAVEVGYEYAGNGTDFWPRLSEDLRHDFSVDDRERLSRWFVKASEKFGGVTPGDSDWELAFRHIAWPITHAVAPKDIRRPFADCLRRLRRDVKRETLLDETIVSDLAQISTPVGSRRFRTWMKRSAVVAGIVRELLGGRTLVEAGLFSETFASRLINDLRNEPEIKQAIRQARTAAQAKRVGTAAEEASQNEVRFGEFFLRQDETGGFQMCGEMPEMDKSIQAALKPIRRRWKPRPWGYGGASPIPSDCLRSARGHFVLSFSYIARANADTPFFAGVDEPSVDEATRQWLQSVRFPAAEILAFPKMNMEDDVAHAIGDRTPHRGLIWVVARRGDIQRRCEELEEMSGERIGEVEGGEIYQFDADNATIREWLGWPAANSTPTETGTPFTWLRPSPVSIESKGLPVYTTDDELGISVVDEPSVQVTLRKEANELARAEVDAVATVSLESSGNYTLEVSKDGCQIDSFSFVIADNKGDGFIEPDPEVPWRAIVTHVDAGETELTRGDLFNGRLNLEIVGDRGIENLNARLSILPADVVAEVRLDRIPARLAPNHPVWEKLRDQIPAAILKSPIDLELKVEVAGLSCDRWLLEAEVSKVWWEEDEDGLPIAISDDGPFPAQHHCIVKDVCIDQPVEGDPFVSVAMDAEGNELHFDARVGVVGHAILGRQLARPRRMLRQVNDLGDINGLRHITQRYLQVAAASSSSMPAEINRVRARQTLRDWIVHCVCGPNWIHQQRENQEQVERVDPVAVWWDCQLSHQDILIPVPDEPRKLPDELPRLVLDEFAEVLPDCWWDGVVPEVTADDAEPLDAIFHHLLDDDSIIVDAEALTHSLRQASERLCGAHLADLLIPAEAGDELLTWSTLDMSVTEAAKSLLVWIRDRLSRGRGRRSWTAKELTLWLNLLLYPERLRREAWEPAIEKLLHDRPVARAGAFVAWRFEQSSRLAASRVKWERV